MKWYSYSYSKGATETPPDNVLDANTLSALKMAFDASRCKQSSTSRSTSTAMLSTKENETSDCPVNSPSSPKRVARNRTRTQ
jgi:hypothetical protein